MNPIVNELRELSAVRSDADPVVTVYLNTRWSDEMQRDRVRLFVRQKVKWAREQGIDSGLGRSLDRIERYVEGLCRQAYDESANGVAIFACDGLGLWKTITARRTFEPYFALADVPHVLQLARAVDDFEPVVVAFVDAKGARVFETAVGELLAEARIVESTPKRHSMGGWSQLKFQRRVEKEIERNLAEAAEHVAYLVQLEPRNHVVLVGPHEMVRHFEARLPHFVRERIMARMPHQRPRGPKKGAIRDDLLEQVIDRLIDHEREKESDNADRVVGEALAGGLAVVGPEDVVLAANEERVHLLVIEEDFDEPGWRCRQCEALSATGPIECRYCGGPVDGVDLGQALIRRVLRASGDVDVVAHQPRLHHYRGVGAFLRHRGALQREVGTTSPAPFF